METVLVARAKALLRTGQLPRERFVCAGGPSHGRVCLVCESQIPRGALEIEIEWLDGDDSRRVAVHLQCESAWRAAIAAM